MRMALACALIALFAASGCADSFDATPANEARARDVDGWTTYGGPGGSHYTELDQIQPANVSDLEVAWIHRTGDLGTVFQSTPIVAAGQLVFCSPHNQVIALDPLTGGEIWRFDPEVPVHGRYANEGNCRGVSHWTSEESQGACGERILTATNDARLIALDAHSGQPCADFGDGGTVDLARGVGRIAWDGEYQVTSAPAIAGDLAIVGSAVSDGMRVDAPSGVVRAFDVRTGALAWAFDLAPPDFDHATMPVSDAGWALGTPNVWAPMSVDAARDLVFLPTGNPAPDYFRAGPVDMDHYGSSVLALRASSGELVWQFRTVNHDFWDFDVPSQPVLVDLTLGGASVPAVIQATKMGFVFVLHRETGEPLVEVVQQPVPVEGPLSDALAPTQPFPPPAFQVSPEYTMGQSLLGLCDETDAESRVGPVYTPITEQWTIGLPSNMGATNWGGVAVDAERGLIAVNVSNVPFRTRLIAREAAADFLGIWEDPALSTEERRALRREMEAALDIPRGTEIAPQSGTDYLMTRHVYTDSLVGLPCSGPPFGEMLVIDIAEESQVWRRNHGTTRDAGVVPLPIGMVGTAGTMVTASGMIIAGNGSERAIRAYDIGSGEELWHHRLPEAANATPMSYAVMTDSGPRQFILVAAGGDARTGIGGQSDHVIAFALPDD